MDELKSAVRKLIDSGFIVLPDALEELKQSHNPLKLVNKFVKNNPKTKTVNRKNFQEVARINSNSTHNMVKNFEKNILSILHSKGKVQRRKYLQSGINVVSDVKKTKKLEHYTNNQENKTRTVIQTSLDDLQGLKNFESDFKVIKNYQSSQNFLGSIEDLVGYFQDRFNKLSNIFRERVDLIGITRIKEIKRAEGQISVIGMVTEKKILPGKSGRLKIEDPSSDRVLQIFIPKSNFGLLEESTHIMSDSVICVIGYLKNGNLIANEILLPEIPTLRKQKRANKPVHVAFLSDLHIGSNHFLHDSFNGFIEFLNGNYGNRKMKALGKQTKYVLFCGDVVDGIGIYPDQISELNLSSIRDQYDTFTGYIERIPEDVQVVIIPGNHDMVRPAEPQPRITEKYTPRLEKLPNVHMLSNPSQISVHDIEILLYHCTSIFDIANQIPGLSVNKPGEIMKQMLKVRHMAPIWGSKTPIAAENQDHLVIDRLPDIFHGGHIHINGEGHYRGIYIINSGTMQEQTSYQKSLNINPTPGLVTVQNLQNHKLNRLDFMKS